METPGIWSDNLVRNFERIIEWCESVKFMCEISAHDYELYTVKMTHDIKDEHLQSAIQNHGFNFGFILKWIWTGVSSLNTNPRLPSVCLLDANVDYKKYETAWKKHINIERQVLDDLAKSMTLLITEAKEKIKTFYDELSDGYSSYSDYSEESTSSDDEEDNDDNGINEDYEVDQEDDGDEENDEEEIIPVKEPVKQKRGGRK